MIWIWNSTNSWPDPGINHSGSTTLLLTENSPSSTPRQVDLILDLPGELVVGEVLLSVTRVDHLQQIQFCHHTRERENQNQGSQPQEFSDSRAADPVGSV